MRKSFNEATLARFRQMPIEFVLARLAIHLKADPTYAPVKNGTSRRWHVRTACGEFELLTTGRKWWDTRAGKGGGGAIDLAMHVMELSFVEAVRLLLELERLHG